jgi:uncharacterized protein YdeI (YjbR/CyaY-like superfamily)
MPVRITNDAMACHGIRETRQLYCRPCARANYCILAAMQMKKTVTAASSPEWRTWLQQNHASEKEIWLVYFKKHSGKSSITYQESLEEALCFGWIDSLIQRIDEESYARKFTPRQPGSLWSELNKHLVARLVKSGRMTEVGMAGVDFPLPDASAPLPVRQSLPIPEWLISGLSASPSALEFFRSLPPSQQELYVRWLSDTKKEETRRKRIGEAIRKLEKHERLGIKS